MRDRFLYLDKGEYMRAELWLMAIQTLPGGAPTPVVIPDNYCTVDGEVLEVQFRSRDRVEVEFIAQVCAWYMGMSNQELFGM